MNVYIVTKYSEDLNKQLHPVGAALSKGGALYLLYKELNNDYEEEKFSMQDIEEALDNYLEISFNKIKYSIYKTELLNN